MPPLKVDGGIDTHDTGLSANLWSRAKSLFGAETDWKRDIFIDGLTPNMVKLVDQSDHPHLVAIAGIDCVTRAHIVTGEGIDSVEALRGKRLGISARRDTTTGFVALTLARRMGWDPVADISIKLNGRDVAALRDGHVDAIVASETRYAEAIKAGYRSILDTTEWNEAIAGNSVMVEREWLANATNREAARRFLKATIEALSLFHTNPETAKHIFSKWHGIADPQILEIVYERGRWLSRVPMPCYDGIANTMKLYDSNGMRGYTASDFYDDSLLRELEADGFIEQFARPQSP